MEQEYVSKPLHLGEGGERGVLHSIVQGGIWEKSLHLGGVEQSHSRVTLVAIKRMVIHNRKEDKQ